MEKYFEKIQVHEGVQLFRQSQWTMFSEHIGLKIFLLAGLRDKEILATCQTSEDALTKDLETYFSGTNGGFPLNTKLTGLYFQYQIKDDAQFAKLIKAAVKQAGELGIMPVQNFMVIHKEMKGQSDINEGIHCSFYQADKTFTPDFEHIDLKRDYLLNNFFYLSLRLAFEGFQEDLNDFQKEIVLNLQGDQPNTFALFKPLNLLQPLQTCLNEPDFGKKLNVEVKKLIKVNKEKQLSYNFIKLELISQKKPSNSCPKYRMEHTEKKQVRRFEINLVSIMQAQDNLHDQMRGFIRDVVSHLKANLFPQLEKSNVSQYTFNIRESALLVQSQYVYPTQSFHSTLKPQDYVNQRQLICDKFTYGVPSPRFRVQNAVEFKIEIGYDRPVDIHSSLMKKDNFEGSPSSKYVVNGSYLYYHYMQDNFNDNGWGCAYRSLQTLLSYFKCEGYATPSFEVPNHKEIQTALVELEDKEKSIIGSSQWIGAFEVNLCVQNFMGVDCRIMNLSSGAELATKGRELRDHFLKDGTPIMIGGDLYAHIILGVDFCEEKDDVRFLILDPHYPGGDSNIKNILSKGWVAWKDANMFKADAFYNLCMPQLPRDP